MRHGECKSILNRLEQEKAKDPFKYVYALHSLGKQNSALTNIDALNIDKSEYHSSLLHAQILYKLDQKEKASEVYEDVLKSDNKNLEADMNEILTNLLASYTNSHDLTQEQLQKTEEKITGEISSDLAFNAAAAYSTVYNQEKTAAKKLKESYTIAKEHNEGDNNKYPLLATFIVAKVLSRATNPSECDLKTLYTNEEDGVEFDSGVNKAIYLNNIACIQSAMGKSIKDVSEVVSQISSIVKSKDINEHQKETFTNNLACLTHKQNNDVKKMIPSH